MREAVAVRGVWGAEFAVDDANDEEKQDDDVASEASTSTALIEGALWDAPEELAAPAAVPRWWTQRTATSAVRLTEFCANWFAASSWCSPASH